MVATRPPGAHAVPAAARKLRSVRKFIFHCVAMEIQDSQERGVKKSIWRSRLPGTRNDATGFQVNTLILLMKTD